MGSKTKLMVFVLVLVLSIICFVGCGKVKQYNSVEDERSKTNATQSSKTTECNSMNDEINEVLETTEAQVIGSVENETIEATEETKDINDEEEKAGYNEISDIDEESAEEQPTREHSGQIDEIEKSPEKSGENILDELVDIEEI